MVNGRRRRLEVIRIQNTNGVCLAEIGQIKEDAIKVFEKQFTQEDEGTNFEILNKMPLIVTDEENILLCSTPPMKEIKAVVFFNERE